MVQVLAQRLGGLRVYRELCRLLQARGMCTLVYLLRCLRCPAVPGHAGTRLPAAPAAGLVHPLCQACVPGQSKIPSLKFNARVSPW